VRQDLISLWSCWRVEFIVGITLQGSQVLTPESTGRV
jgi:hypothetical protein